MTDIPHTYYSTGQIPLANPASGSSVWAVLWGEGTSLSHNNMSPYVIQSNVMSWASPYKMSYFRNIQVYDSTGLWVHGTGDGAQPRCFAPDTEVRMEDGSYRLLRDVRVGDRVAAAVVRMDDDYMEWRDSGPVIRIVGSTVTDVHYVYSTEQYVLNGELVTTKPHPFLVRNLLNDNYGYMRANDLQVDCYALVGHDLGLAPLRAADRVESDVEVMSLSTDADTFVVRAGGTECIVHT